DFWKITMAAVGAGGVDASNFLLAIADENGRATADVAKIYQLQAAFHRAKTAQDIGLMMSLFDPNATLRVHGDAKSPYVGTGQLRALAEFGVVQEPAVFVSAVVQDTHRGPR